MKIVLLFVLLLFSTKVFSWGRIGHMTIARLAQNQLTPTAFNNLSSLLEENNLAWVANWADDIRLSEKWKHTKSWHYFDYDGDRYRPTIKSRGKLLNAVCSSFHVLNNSVFSKKSKKNALKFLIHFIGDIHQPFHSAGLDQKGGSQQKVKWFYLDTNIHLIWDHEMIQLQKLSFSEYTEFLEDRLRLVEQKNKWLHQGPLGWMLENKRLLKQALWDYPDHKYAGFIYTRLHIDKLNKRLMQAGLRLGHILNYLFDEEYSVNWENYEQYFPKVFYDSAML